MSITLSEPVATAFSCFARLLADDAAALLAFAGPLLAPALPVDVSCDLSFPGRLLELPFFRMLCAVPVVELVGAEQSALAMAGLPCLAPEALGVLPVLGDALLLSAVLDEAGAGMLLAVPLLVVAAAVLEATALLAVAGA